jgi:zinc protease
MSTPEIKTHRFSNGFRVIYQQSEQTVPVSCIHLFCNVGSAYETNGIRGASHLVEHMCFKGTESIRKARNLLMQYNKIGADFNAYTEKRFTTYHINCDDTYFEHSTKLLATMLLHSIFSKKEFEKEQKVVVEENIRAEDNPNNILEDRLNSIYYRGSSYAYPIDTIQYHTSYLKYDDMYNWYKWFYHPSNMVCSIVSNLSFSRIISILKGTDFMESNPLLETPLPIALSYPNLSLLPISDQCKEPRIEYIKKKGMSATILSIGFRTCNYYSPDKNILMLLQQILNGFSGKLFTALRTKHGLTYSSGCISEYQEHTGYFAIKVLTDPSKLMKDQEHHDGVLPVLIDLLLHLQHNGITSEDLQVAKGKIKGSFLLELQSINTVASYNGIQAVLPGSAPIVPYQDIFETYLEKVTKSQIEKIIKKYIRKENMLVGILYDHMVSKKKIEEIVNQLT